MNYEELLSAYNNLKAENEHLYALLQENGIEYNFAKNISIAPQKEISDALPFNGVNKSSSTDNKIALFMSLFIGKTDVYAKRWVSKKTGKSGYSSACIHEWDKNLCKKGTLKCNECKNRELAKLNEKALFNHLSKNATESDVVGIYPMLNDETTRILVIDFDDENWERDVSAIRATCKKLDIPIAIERSRSGNGGHCWFFFDKPIEAKLARKFGSSLISYSMNNEHTIKLTSYDRLLPNQDTMPSGGFGNLIALPLQGLARKQENSLFVDENFVAYEDQWEYLSNIKKISRSETENFISILNAEGELGYLGLDTEDLKPWEKNRKSDKIVSSDVPAKTEIIISNMIYLNKSEFSQKALNKIKRLAAFKNPDFYKKQAMRFSTHNIPRIISTAEVYENYIALPRGSFDALCNLLISAGCDCSFKDETVKGNAIDVKFNGELRDKQQLAANAMLFHNNGVLSATTAFGKTVVGGYLIAQRKVNTLILVHSSALLNQWKKSLEEFLVFDGDMPTYTTPTGKIKTRGFIGQLGNNKNTLNGIVDIAIMQSLVSGDEVKELVKNYGMVIVDECHHVSAVSFERILKEVCAKYVYGLTATPTRQDGQQPIIFMQCGPIRYTVNALEQSLKSDFERFMIPRFTHLRLKNEESSINDIYAEIIKSSARNTMIINDVLAALKEERNPIILTERYEHAIEIYNELKKHFENVFLLTGKGTNKEKREVIEKLRSITGTFAVVATGKYVGEGFDEPRLDTLFLAMPIAWKGTLAQYVGRLHRNYIGKNEVISYDYVDIHIPMLERMYFKRLKGYANLGYKIKDFSDNNAKGLIFDRTRFTKIFAEDLQNIRYSATIVSPFLSKNRLNQIIGILSQARANKAKITVITRPPEDFKDNNITETQSNISTLEAVGITVITQSNIHQKYAIIDSNIVWYGSINLLSFGSSQESIMRFQNRELAEELLSEAEKSLDNKSLFD